MVDGGLWRGKEGAVVNQHGGRISIALWARVLISKYGGWRTLEGERFDIDGLALVVISWN